MTTLNQEFAAFQRTKGAMVSNPRPSRADLAVDFASYVQEKGVTHSEAEWAAFAREKLGMDDDEIVDFLESDVAVP